MNAQDLAKMIDHTLLKPEATVEQIKAVCREAREHQFFSVCVNTSYLPLIKRELAGSAVKACVVVGFPLGAMATEAKVAETQWAVAHGADEVDMVINNGWYRSGMLPEVQEDIAAVVKAAGGKLVKVIFETSLMQPADISTLTKMSVTAGAQFVKTSTGFGSRGASRDDIATMLETLKGLGKVGQVGIKASGGVRTLAQAQEMIAAGATRIGSSNSVGMLAELK